MLMASRPWNKWGEGWKVILLSPPLPDKGLDTVNELNLSNGSGFWRGGFKGRRSDDIWRHNNPPPLWVNQQDGPDFALCVGLHVSPFVWWASAAGEAQNTRDTRSSLDSELCFRFHTRWDTPHTYIGRRFLRQVTINLSLLSLSVCFHSGGEYYYLYLFLCLSLLHLFLIKDTTVGPCAAVAVHAFMLSIFFYPWYKEG